eukprot:1670327-Rhodomonas_salina.2
MSCPALICGCDHSTPHQAGLGPGHDAGDDCEGDCGSSRRGVSRAFGVGWRRGHRARHAAGVLLGSERVAGAEQDGDARLEGRAGVLDVRRKAAVQDDIHDGHRAHTQAGRRRAADQGREPRLGGALCRRGPQNREHQRGCRGLDAPDGRDREPDPAAAGGKRAARDADPGAVGRRQLRGALRDGSAAVHPLHRRHGGDGGDGARRREHPRGAREQGRRRGRRAARALQGGARETRHEAGVRGGDGVAQVRDQGRLDRGAARGADGRARGLCRGDGRAVRCRGPGARAHPRGRRCRPHLRHAGAHFLASSSSSW